MRRGISFGVPLNSSPPWESPAWWLWKLPMLCSYAPANGPRMSAAWGNGSRSIACKNCCNSRTLRPRRRFAYTVPVNPIRFGTDGWRGVIADDFTFENVRKVAFAIARYIVRAEKPAQGVIVGYDNRFGSERFARAVADTMASADLPVWLSTSACPSPAVS